MKWWIISHDWCEAAYAFDSSFWLEAKANAVVVEADAFKETDVIYRALSRSTGHHHEMLHTAELVNLFNYLSLKT